MTDTTHTIKSIFSAVQKIPINDIDTTANIFEVYHVDSLKAVKLLSTLEVELDIEIPEAEMQRIRTLDDVSVIVTRLLK